MSLRNLLSPILQPGLVERSGEDYRWWLSILEEDLAKIWYGSRKSDSKPVSLFQLSEQGLVELKIIPLVAEELSTLYTPVVKVFAES